MIVQPVYARTLDLRRWKWNVYCIADVLRIDQIIIGIVSTKDAYIALLHKVFNEILVAVVKIQYQKRVRRQSPSHQNPTWMLVPPPLIASSRRQPQQRTLTRDVQWQWHSCVQCEPHPIFQSATCCLSWWTIVIGNGCAGGSLR